MNDKGVVPIASPGYDVAGQPHLLQYLWAKFAEHLEEEIARRVEARISTVDLPTALKQVPATHFYGWATTYLTNTSVVDSFFIEGNLGIRLSTNETVAFSPQAFLEDRQQVKTVGITTGRQQNV